MSFASLSVPEPAAPRGAPTVSLMRHQSHFAAGDIRSAALREKPQRGPAVRVSRS